MQVSFTFDNLDEAARVLELLNDGDWPNPTASGANASRNGGRAGGSASASAEDRPPWEADEADAASSERAANEPASDPWADGGSASSSASGGNSGRSSSKQADFSDVPSSGYDTKATASAFLGYVFGSSDAPNCEHDQPAVLVRGWKGMDHADGDPDWAQWRCALSATKGWKDKCDFQDWANDVKTKARKKSRR
jgi:hypothetical protein